MAARFKAWVFGRSLAGIVDSNPAGAWRLALLSVVSCQVEVSASGWSLVQRSSTECDVSECNLEASTVRRPRLARGYCAMKEKQDVGTTSPRTPVTISAPTRHYIPQYLNLLHMHLITAVAVTATTTATITRTTTTATIRATTTTATTTNTGSSSSSSSSNYSPF